MSVCDLSSMTSISNETNFTASPFVESSFPPSLIISNLLVSCLLIISVWITLALIHHGSKTGKWRQLKTHNRVDQLNFGHIHSSIVLCGILVFFYDIVGLVYINTGFKPDTNHTHTRLNDYCDSISDLVYCAYGFVLLSTSKGFFSKPVAECKLQQICQVH